MSGNINRSLKSSKSRDKESRSLRSSNSRDKESRGLRSSNSRDKESRGLRSSNSRDKENDHKALSLKKNPKEGRRNIEGRTMKNLKKLLSIISVG